MQSSNSTILGIDPGLGRVGFGVVFLRRGTPSLGRFGVIETPKGLPAGERLMLIHKRLLALIRETRPDRIGIEKLFFSKNVKTALMVGEARGVLLLAAAETGVPIMEITPSAMKLAVVGYGAAEKRQVQRMLQVQFHLEHPPTPDDAADAIAIALCGARPSYV